MVHKYLNVPGASGITDVPLNWSVRYCGQFDIHVIYLYLRRKTKL